MWRTNVKQSTWAIAGVERANTRAFATYHLRSMFSHSVGATLYVCIFRILNNQCVGQCEGISPINISSIWTLSNAIESISRRTSNLPTVQFNRKCCSFSHRAQTQRRSQHKWRINNLLAKCMWVPLIRIEKPIWIEHTCIGHSASFKFIAHRWAKLPFDFVAEWLCPLLHPSRPPKGSRARATGTDRWNSYNRREENKMNDAAKFILI